MDNEKEVTQQTTEKKEDKKLSLKDLMDKKKAENDIQTVNTEEKNSTVKRVQGLSSTDLEQAGNRLQRVSVAQIGVPKGAPIQDYKPEMDKAMERLDIAIERTKEDLKPIIEKGREIIQDNLDRKAEEESKIKEAGEKLLKSEAEDTDDFDLEEDTGEVNLPSAEEFEKDFLLDDELEDNDSEEGFVEQPTEVQEDTQDETIELKEEDNTVDDLYEGMSEEERQKETQKRFKELIKEEGVDLNPIKNKINFREFKVKTKPVAYSKLLSITGKEKQEYTSEWVLPFSKKAITVSSLSGSEIAILTPIFAKDMLTVNDFVRIFGLVFKHLIDKNKPATMEQWLKTINYQDINHIYFALYKASFESTNYIPFLCNKCHNTELNKYDISEMYTLGNDETKSLVESLLNSDTTSKSTVEEKFVQISEDYAVTLRQPSIYTMNFENRVLYNNDNMLKYASIISIISFITNIYVINRQTNELIAVDTQPVQNDIRKTVKNKFRVYYKIISSLSSEEFQILNGAVDKLAAANNDIQITYHIPEHKCSRCGTVLPKENIENPMSLVFMRHQLTLLAD